MEHSEHLSQLAETSTALTTENSPLPDKYIIAATSNNTRRAYQSDIRQFIQWGGLLPATPQQIVRYLHDEAEHCNPNTLSRRLTALSKWHEYQEFQDPTHHPLVRKTMTGIRNVHGKPKAKAPALSLEDLAKLIDFLKRRGSLRDLRDCALILIGYFGALRRSELVGILFEELTFVTQGVEILIPKSKTDQAGEGQICAIPYGNERLCAVRALQAWCYEAGIEQGPIFRALNRHENLLQQALTPQNVNTILKNAASACLLSNAAQLSGHSLRRGFATSASQRGASFASIKKQGRWKCETTVLGYFEEGQRFNDNAADVLLKELG